MFAAGWKRRFGAALTALAMAVLLAAPVFAAETAATMQLTKTEGTVSIFNVSGREVSVREKLRLYNGYTIKTEASSYAWIALDDSKLAKLDAASEVEVRKNGKKLELLLSSGNIFFNVTEPLKEDENLNICTSSMVAGIRGTSGWVSTSDGGSVVAILEGTVLCSALSGNVQVKAGQISSFNGSGEVVSEKIDLTQTPGFVLTEVVADPVLCAEILEASGLNAAAISPAQAAAIQAADEARTAQAIASAEKAAEQQAASVPAQPSDRSDSSDSSNSGSGGSSNETVRPDVPVTPDTPSKPVSPEKPVETGTTVGAFIVTGGTEGVDFKFEDQVLTILTDRPLSIRNKGVVILTSDSIAVSPDAPGANITLDGVHIDTSAKEKTAAFLIPDNYEKNVTISLAKYSVNQLHSSPKCAGLQKNDGIGLLTIDGEGSLSATGGSNSAGIGGSYHSNGHSSGTNIIISGGIVVATGGDGGAGIGGGYGGDGTNIKITGGTVTATGGERSAGIGGGWSGDGTSIEITGGTVTAEGSEFGAGIGGGQNGGGTNITIENGIVTATGGKSGAGIGGGYSGGYSGGGTNIRISGGTVTAEGGQCGAGIGGGSGGDGTDITISGGAVTAVGNYNSTGIGGGQNGNGTNITISDGTVTATGGQNSAGIGGGGGGSNVYGTNITITGGTVTAKGGDSTKPGIGSASYPQINVEISGGAFVYIETGKAPSSGLKVTQGIVFYPDTDNSIIGLVAGNVTFPVGIGIPPYETLTISENATLTIPVGVTLENIDGSGTVKDSAGTVLYSNSQAPAMALFSAETEIECPPDAAEKFEPPTESEAPDTPEPPAEPDAPKDPETPAEPEAPNTPEPPAEPDAPKDQETSTEPDAPKGQEPPAEPDTSGIPETPAEPVAPEGPKDPTELEAPTDPEDPSPPTGPETPLTPDISEGSGVSPEGPPGVDPPPPDG